MTCRDFSKLDFEGTEDEDIPTKSSTEQESVERNCLKLYKLISNSTKNDGSKNDLLLHRENTLKFLIKGLGCLSRGYECLDASRPWILYWILHSIELLDGSIQDSLKDSIANFLSKCQNPDGGFGGGPGQISHLAPTYASVNALIILGTEKAFKIINRTKLAEWMNSLRLSDGSFLMHLDGEVDIRGTYCALSVARLTNIYSESLFKGTPQWIIRCQTYEGGFGGVPGMEAHGGYSFCGIASLLLMDKGMLCNLDLLMRWAARRQMRLEGGFQGRTNKLVDGCYSFWQGGIFPLIHMTIAKHEPDRRPSLSDVRWMFHQEALQEYLIICCQDPRGGLIDKPGKSRDFYHTCYALSGLSVSQHFGDKNYPIGGKQNLLKPTHSLFNIGIDSVIKSSKYFEPLEVPKFK